METRTRRLLEEGIVLFNRGQFFEAHEVWEDAWRRARGGEERLLHGLIQVAAGFHKWQCGQPSGTVSLLAKGLEKLSTIPETSFDLDLRPLRGSTEAWKEAATRMAAPGASEYGASALPRLPEPPRRSFLHHLHSHIEIRTPVGRVWDVLADFPAYPGWNPFIVKIEGRAAVGERPAIEARPAGLRGMAFKPRVLVADRHRELRWLGRLILPGVFDGEHVFTIAPLGAGRARFSQRVTFRGLLVPILPRRFWDAISRGFEEMNRALKRRAEAAREKEV